MSTKSDALKIRIDEQQQAIGKLIEHGKLQGSLLEKIIKEQQATINYHQHLIGVIMGQLEQQRQETLHSRSKRRDVVIDRSPFPPYNPTIPALRRNPHTPGAFRDEGGALKRQKPLGGQPSYRSINSRPKAGGTNTSSKRRIDSDTRGTTSSSRSAQTDDQEPTTRLVYSPRSIVLEEDEIYGYIKSPQLMVLLSEFEDDETKLASERRQDTDAGSTSERRQENETGSTSKRRQDNEAEEEARDQVKSDDTDRDRLYPTRPPLSLQYHETIKKLVGTNRYDDVMDLLQKSVSELVQQLATKFQLSFEVHWDFLGDHRRQYGINALETLLMEQNIPIIRSANQWIAKGLLEREWDYENDKYMYRKFRNNNDRQPTAPPSPPPVTKPHLPRKHIQIGPRTKNRNYLFSNTL